MFNFSRMEKAQETREFPTNEVPWVERCILPHRTFATRLCFFLFLSWRTKLNEIFLVFHPLNEESFEQIKRFCVMELPRN